MNTPMSERLHIGFFGCRNAGKSSLVNAVTNQEMAVVSEVKGTTTDPVKKSMELLPLGPVVIIDTPGFDDEGILGEKRVIKTKQILNRIDIAVLVVDGVVGLNEFDGQLTDIFKEKNIPYIIAYNKADITQVKADDGILVSAKTKMGIEELKEKIASLKTTENKRIVGDLISENDIILLVTPIDKSAPKGRLILPQQMTIRDILDSNGISVVTKETQLKEALSRLKPKMVITDSQVFGKVAEIVPNDIPLTSFSILMAGYKGFLETAVKGAYTLDNLKDGDTVLISEGCTHHRQCEDIGTVKLPKWIKEYTQKEISFEFTQGGDFPEDIEKYALIVHCGGCMLNEREMLYRMKCAEDKNVPITNYGTAIAHIKGILKRSLEIFKSR